MAPFNSPAGSEVHETEVVVPITQLDGLDNVGFQADPLIDAWDMPPNPPEQSAGDSVSEGLPVRVICFP